jgi:hypothetical protein
MQRREFIGLIGGAAAWPLAARAQQPANLPLVAVIVAFAEQLANARSANIREGLKRAGFIEGKDYVMTLRFDQGGVSVNKRIGFFDAMSASGSITRSVRDVRVFNRT